MSIVSNRDNLYLGYYLHYSTPGCGKELLRDHLPFTFLKEKRELEDWEFELARILVPEPEPGCSIPEYLTDIKEDKQFPIIFVKYYHRDDYDKRYYMVIRYELQNHIFGIGRKIDPHIADLQDRCLKIYDIDRVDFDEGTEDYFDFSRKSRRKIYYNDAICSSIGSLGKIYYGKEGIGFIISLFDKIERKRKVFLFFKYYNVPAGYWSIHAIRDYPELHCILNQIGTYEANPWDIIMIEWALSGGCIPYL